MSLPSDHEIVFSLTRTTARGLIKQGYDQGYAEARSHYMRPHLGHHHIIGFLVSVAVAFCVGLYATELQSIAMNIWP